MPLAIRDLPGSMDAMSTYRYFHLSHDSSIESLHSLVLNDVAIERAVARASTDFGFGIITKVEYVRAINTAITDRTALRQMVDTQVHFDDEAAGLKEEFDRILADQIDVYLAIAKHDLDEVGIKYKLSPRHGLELV